MSKIVFVKPELEADAVWDPIRTCSYLGIWFMASLLKSLGHQVWYLDEIVRDGGLKKRTLSRRTLRGSEVEEKSIAVSPEKFQIRKMADYHSLSTVDFVKKYSAFKENGVIERIIVRIGNPEEETLAKIVAINPDFVGIPLIATANYIPATSLARKIKERLPKTRIIFGGQHISAQPEEFLTKNPFVDHVVIGDAITVINKIVGGSITDKMVYGEFQEMSEYPLLDPTIIAEAGYPLEPTYTFPTSGRKSVDFMFSRGCFRRCSFCVAGCQKTHVSATDYRRLDEQLRIFKENGIQELVIQDDAFLWDRHHVKEHLPMIFSAMKKYGFYWQNNGGLDFEGLTDWVTDQIVAYNQSEESHCTALYIPFNPREWNKHESATGSMTRRYHANMENLKRLRQAGIYVFTSTIIGTPEQTLETFGEELEIVHMMIKEGYLDAALPLSATMLPGTVWYQTNGHNIVNKRDFPGYSLFTTHHKTDHLSSQEIEILMIRFLKELEDVQRVFPWGTAFPSPSS